MNSLENRIDDLEITLKWDRESGRKTASFNDQIVTLHGDRLRELASLMVTKLESDIVKSLGKRDTSNNDINVLSSYVIGGKVYINSILWDEFYSKNLDLDENGDPY